MPIQSTNPSSLFARPYVPAFGRQLAASGAPQVAATPKSDQVSLSNAGRARQLQDSSGTGSSSSTNNNQVTPTEADQEKQALASLTRASLSALGITKGSDASQVTISFDSLSFESYSSTSLSVTQSQSNSNSNSTTQNQQITQFHSEQQSAYIGKGHIVTADGRQFEFESELDISSVTDITQASSSSVGNIGNGGNGSSGENSGSGNAGNVSDAGNAFHVPQFTLPKPLDLATATDQLLDLLQRVSDHTQAIAKPATPPTPLAAQPSAQPNKFDYLKSLTADALAAAQLAKQAATAAQTAKPAAANANAGNAANAANATAAA